MTDIKVGGAKGIPAILVATDDVTNTLQVIDYPHHEVHAGGHFFFESFIELASGGVQVIEITTPNSTKWLHFLSTIKTDLAAIVQFIEAPTAGTGGTVQTPINNNRNSSKTSTAILKTGVSAGSGGTVLFNRHVGSGSNPSQATPGEAERDSEIILKQNTIYQLVITSESSSNNVDYRLSWYEHTSKN